MLIDVKDSRKKTEDEYREHEGSIKQLCLVIINPNF